MAGEIARYVTTVRFHEETLTEINELNNHLTRAGFTLTLTDDDGTVHELGTNSFGFVSPLPPDDIKALAQGLAEAALGQKPQVEVVLFDNWLKDR